jgi:FixJ family two-component response regulator
MEAHYKILVNLAQLGSIDFVMKMLDSQVLRAATLKQLVDVASQVRSTEFGAWLQRKIQDLPDHERQSLQHIK